MTAATVLAKGHTVAGHVLHRPLGSGTHGTVYLASPVGRKRLVALKLIALPPGDAAAAAERTFLEAARAAKSLRHPDVVHVHSAAVEAGWCWLSMEPVPGSELGRYVRPPRLLPEALVLRIGQRMARALAYAHRQGVVHRDVKPANVLVHWPSNTVKLTDFGLARIAGGSNTATGLLLGSPAYMAPEQLAGNIPTAQSDLYAPGVMRYELLAGRPAFAGRTMGELLQQVTQGPPPELQAARPDLPPSISVLLAGLLARSPADRPANGESVAEALEAASLQLPPPAAWAPTGVPITSVPGAHKR